MSLTLRGPTPVLARSVRRSSGRAIATIVGFVVLLVGVCAMHGFLPGTSPPMVWTIEDSGLIKCLHDAGWAALSGHCNAVGRPLGFTFLTGLPETMLGWLISWLPGVDAWTANQILNIVLDAVALGGGYLLLRRWSVVRPVALLAPALYLVSPSLLSVNGFGTTFAGYAFLPLYVYLFLCGLDRFAEGQRRWIGAAYLGGVTLLMVFTDGYSYATALLIICMMLIWWLFRGGAALNARLAALGTFAAANLCALAAYSVYTNAPATPDVGIGAYRYLGLDPVTLFIPEATLWWPSHIGYQPPVLYPRLWGDGSNILHNYMGFAMIGIVAWFLLSRRLRRQPAGQRLEIAPLFVAGSVALFLSLGPALKIASRAVPISPSWDVPVSKTVIGLPTVFLYRFIPPFDDMRATFRWSIGFRFVLIFASAYAINVIWKSGRRQIATLLLVVSFLEVLPAPRLQIAIGRSYSRQVSMVRSQVIGEFDAMTSPGERVLMVPSNNDFLATAMAPFAHVSTYNVGGDKNYAASASGWPADVKLLVAKIGESAGQGDRIATVLQHDANAVVICFFSMYTGGTMWPAPLPNEEFFRRQAATLAQDPRFVVQQGSWMAVITKRE